MPNNKEKVALFDFCETIANFQTADEYVNYTRNYYGNLKMKIWSLLHLLAARFQIISLLEYFYPKASINKRFIARQLSNEPLEKLDKAAREYYQNIIRPNLIHTVISEVMRLKKEGYRVMLISGGYNIYLRYFAKEFDIEDTDVIATRLRFSNGKCTGSFEGKDCLFEEKTSRLNLLFPNKDNYYFLAYSDSESDRPMLDWADQGVVIRKKGAPKWDLNNQYKELLWEK